MTATGPEVAETVATDLDAGTSDGASRGATIPEESDDRVEDGGDAGPSASAASPTFSTALVTSVTLDLPNQHPVVLLRESEPPGRHVSFSVSMPDAVALSHALRRIPTPRPSTHELTGDVLQRFDIDIVAVRLVGRIGGIYFAELDLRGRDRHTIHSCRPSDALTLAMRQPVAAPILVDVRLWEPDIDVTPPAFES